MAVHGLGLLKFHQVGNKGTVSNHYEKRNLIFHQIPLKENMGPVKALFIIPVIQGTTKNFVGEAKTNSWTHPHAFLEPPVT